jgi:hypothetical protein
MYLCHTSDPTHLSLRPELVCGEDGEVKVGFSSQESDGDSLEIKMCGRWCSSARSAQERPDGVCRGG